ncbi:MAG: T9SS type A sorting domain-containing protein [Bacteroidia bacterium]
MIFLVLCCCFLKKATAQHWDSLNSGIDYGGNIYCMYADSVDNYLYITGSILDTGGVQIGGIARWDGTSFSTMGFNGYVRSMIRYRDTLYASGIFYTNGELYVAKWNGSSWDSVGHVHGGAALNLTVYNDELYAMGAFDSIEHEHANNIAKWDGTNWLSLKDTTFNGTISSMAIYNSELYIAGNFYNTSNGEWRIAKWNGTNYVPLSNGGAYGGMDDIVDMAVYKNELYVSGTFSKADGNVGNYIQKWNDTVWSEVGGGVTGLWGSNGQIQDMKVYGNDLYVVGDFQIAGGISANYIAKWDGTNWCSFGSSYDNIITAVGFKNGNMYIGGGFQTIDGDTITSVAEWVGGTYIDTCGHISTGVNEISEIQEINIYPNPATNQITLEFDLTETKNTTIEVKNVLGQTVKSISNIAFQKGTNKIEIDISDFTNGIYFLQLISEHRQLTAKFVKQ